MEPTNWIDTVFDTNRYMPHGFCFLWQPELVWMHALSDVLTAVAYFSIPCVLLYLLRGQQEAIRPYRWVFVLFASFIFLCGVTHVLEIITLWHPVYYLQGLVKVLTAAVSLTTAILIFPLVPELLEKFGAGKPSNKP